MSRVGKSTKDGEPPSAEAHGGSAPQDKRGRLSPSRGSAAAVAAEVATMRDEVASLAAAVGRHDELIERVAAAESRAVELADQLPSRLGHAIAAAIDARQTAFLTNLDRLSGLIEGAVRQLHQHAATQEDPGETAPGPEPDERVPAEAPAAPPVGVALLSERLDRLAAAVGELLGRDPARQVVGSIAPALDAIASQVRELPADVGAPVAIELQALRADLHRATEHLATVVRAPIDRLEQIHTALDAATAQLARVDVDELRGRLDAVVEMLDEPVELDMAAFDERFEKLGHRLESQIRSATDTLAELATEVDGRSAARNAVLTGEIDQPQAVLEGVRNLTGLLDRMPKLRRPGGDRPT